MTFRRLFAVSAIATIAVLLFSATAAAQPTERCGRATRGGDASAAQLLQETRHAMGLEQNRDAIVSFTATEESSWNFQSDRMYPPYLAAAGKIAVWFHPASRVELIEGPAFPDALEGPRVRTLATETATYVERQGSFQKAAALHATTRRSRALDPWAVVSDWSAATGVRLAGRCLYRDKWRNVIARQGPYGDERLYLDDDSHFPVKADRVEPHYLWGQVHVEEVFTTWQRIGPGAYYPLASYRLEDGETALSRTLGFGTSGLLAGVNADSTSKQLIQSVRADTAAQMPLQIAAFLQPTPPDTLRVGSSTFALKNRGYTELVTLQRDTVYVFDATQGEVRARLDSAWIGKLFPGRHPVVLVVTDLAWPHVAGVRFWAASAAKIVTHPLSVGFLRRVLDRRWQLEPDKLERQRHPVSIALRAVTERDNFAGGDIAITEIDGIGAEGGLIALVRNDGVLWASDFIQNVHQPTLYTTEVWRAAGRARMNPKTVVAQHAAPTPWVVIDSLARSEPRTTSEP